MNTDLDALLTTREVTALFKVLPDTIQDWVAQRRLHPVRLEDGRPIRPFKFSVKQIQRVLDNEHRPAPVKGARREFFKRSA